MEDSLIIAYDNCPPDVATLMVMRREKDKVRVLNTIQGDQAFGMYHCLTGGAELKERQGKWKLNKGTAAVLVTSAKLRRRIYGIMIIIRTTAVIVELR